VAAPFARGLAPRPTAAVPCNSSHQQFSALISSHKAELSGCKPCGRVAAAFARGLAPQPSAAVPCNSSHQQFSALISSHKGQLCCCKLCGKVAAPVARGLAPQRNHHMAHRGTLWQHHPATSAAAAAAAAGVLQDKCLIYSLAKMAAILRPYIKFCHRCYILQELCLPASHYPHSCKQLSFPASCNTTP
jgi:hypothetical protein